MQGGSCLVAMMGDCSLVLARDYSIIVVRFHSVVVGVLSLSSGGVQVPLSLLWVGSSLVLVCSHLSSCGRGASFSCGSVMVWLLSSSNVQGGFCLVVMHGWLNNLWHGAPL